MSNSNREHTPPKWIDNLLDWFCSEQHIEILRGDLYELYHERIENGSRLKANLLFFTNVIDMIRPFALKSRNNTQSNRVAMFRNHLKLTYRSFFNHKLYSLLNVSGLALGLACFILIFMYIQDELSFDRFHEKSDRIYRVVEHFESDGVGEHSASQPFPTGPTLKNDFPRQVEQAVRLFNFQSPTLALANEEADKAFNESRVFFADSNFLSVFDFELLVGNRETALDEPNSILISKSMARKYFIDEDPIGKSLEFQGTQELQVTGILEDAPKNAHFQYDFIVSFSSLKPWYNGQYPNGWYWNPCWTYVVLDENVDRTQLESYFPDFVLKYFPEFIREDVSLELQPLHDIHLQSKLDYEIQANSDINNIYIFGAVALFVLVIAAINFINLTTARATKRAKEVGVRKSLGSKKSQLITQFVFESVLLTWLAIIIAQVIVILALPSFNLLTEKSIHPEVLLAPQYLAGLVGLTLVVGLLSGFYPAFVLSSFKTIAVLKNAHQKIQGLSFRRILVTLQFVISVFLIIGTFVALNQLQFLQDQDTGFDQENVLMVPVIRSPIGQYYETFRNTALQSAHIKSMTAVEEVVGAKHQVGNYQFEAMERSKPYPRFFVRHDFAETMNIELAAGRDYSRDVVTDDSLAYVINESMVKALGWDSPEEAVGKRFYFKGQLQGEIVGVVKDYNFISKHHPIGPLVIDLNTRAGAFNLFIKYVSVKVDGRNLSYAIEDLEKAWKSVLPNRPFDFFFLDDRLNDSYKAEQKLSQITVVFSALAIFVACLGLFGLVTFSVERRTKEIGVRKVLGINTPQILVLLSKEFIYLIVIAIFVAIPVSYFLLDLWLQSFAFRITLSVWPFLTAAFLAIMVSLVTVVFQALKASTLNPAKTLKYE